jgi:D-arabinose 1-dehydrogenase-like Zn-dependent alcohol dehydrogenase
VVVPARKLCALPENVPFEVGAVVTDAVAAPFHALVDVARLRAGESVAVVGVGGLGLHAAQIARLMDASPVIAIDPRASQRTRAAERGADLVLGGSPGTEESVREATGGPGVDVAAEFVGGAGSIGRPAGLPRVGGRLVVAGLGAAPPVVFVRQEMAVLGSYGFTVATIRGCCAWWPTAGSTSAARSPTGFPSRRQARRSGPCTRRSTTRDGWSFSRSPAYAPGAAFHVKQPSP